MKESYLNIDDITNSLKINEDTLRQWIKEGKFPSPFKIMIEALYGAMH